jgi:lysophospholipase L1-like esterase
MGGNAMFCDDHFMCQPQPKSTPAGRALLATAVVCVLTLLCSDSPCSAETLRIMPLGDSITAGYTDNPGWNNHPFAFGYRSGLYTRLTDAGYNFLFVGGSTEPWTGISGDPAHGGTVSPPPPDLRDFGQDGHRGYGGASAGDLQRSIVSWLASDDPDIILLKIGTNSQNTVALDTLVNTIVTNKPDAQLIVAEIIPKISYQQSIVNYNTYIRDTLIPKYQGQGKNVTLVDQYVNFLTDSQDLTSIDQSLFANGINHPTNPGYDLMAQTWFEGIEAVVLPEPSTVGLASLGLLTLLSLGWRSRRTK